MKSFKQYLIESQQTYEFKIKIAGDCDSDYADRIKQALVRFNVMSCTQHMRTPIQETHIDFPNHSNVSVTVYEVNTEYPATSAQISTLVAAALNLSEASIRVRNDREHQEVEINHEHDKKSGIALLNEPYPPCDHQAAVGEQRKMALLKELEKNRTVPKPYQGVNDSLLAKRSPSEKKPSLDSTTNSRSLLGNKQTKTPTRGEKQ